MFQLIEDSNLTEILRKELEYFQAVLQFSKKFVNQIPQLSIHVLSEMLNYRQELIDKIQTLEVTRKKLQTDLPGDETEQLIREISEVASLLVEVDIQISTGLQSKKLEYIKQLSDSAVHQHHHYQQKRRGDSDGKMFDIVQE